MSHDENAENENMGDEGKPSPGRSWVVWPYQAYDVIKEALCCHMRAGLMPTAKSAGHLAEALAVALMADKDVRNMAASVESPWPDFKAGGGGGAGVGGLQVEGWSF